MISSSHTVPDPRTVMIESINTTITNLAMMRSQTFNNFTSRTDFGIKNLPIDLDCVRLVLRSEVFGQPARVPYSG